MEEQLWINFVTANAQVVMTYIAVSLASLLRLRRCKEDAHEVYA
jgi:hypothetical protein